MRRNPCSAVLDAEGRRQATLQRSARGGAFFNPAGLELAAFAPGERGTVLTFAAALEGNPFARMALLGATLAAPAPSGKPDLKEQEAAAALKKAGFRLVVTKGDPRLRVTGAVWYQRFDAAGLTVADLDGLRELPHLTSLVVCSPKGFVLDDEAARRLAGLRGLESLDTTGVVFRPGTLARLASM